MPSILARADVKPFGAWDEEKQHWISLPVAYLPFRHTFPISGLNTLLTAFWSYFIMILLDSSAKTCFVLLRNACTIFWLTSGTRYQVSVISHLCESISMVFFHIDFAILMAFSCKWFSIWCSEYPNNFLVQKICLCVHYCGYWQV